MICDQCGEGGESGEFLSNYGKYRGRHKRCHVEMNTRRWYMNKAKKNPNSVFSCDGCDNIFMVNMSTHHPDYSPGAKHTSCPKCGSEDILTFAEMEGKPNAKQ